MAKEFGAWSGFRLSHEPEIITAGTSQIDLFAALLCAEARTRPVVFVSATNWDDGPIVDVCRMARNLTGVAHVAVAADRFVSFALRDRVGPQLNCWNGAVRIYWPGFHRGSNPANHDLWTPAEIDRISDERDFSLEVLGRVAAAAAYTRSEGEVTWEDIDSVRRERERLALVNSGQDAELLRLYEAENAVLKKTSALLEEQLARLGEQLQRETSSHAYWREEYYALRAGNSRKQEDTKVEPTPEPRSVKEALTTAAERFPNRLVVSLNGRSDDETPFEAPADVLRALEFLAGPYWDARIHGGATDFDEALRAFCGGNWFYRGSQSELTMRSRPDWYSTVHNGTRFWLGKHIGRGKAKDPVTSIRLAFEWSESEEKVILGFVGQHQENDAT